MNPLDIEKLKRADLIISDFDGTIARLGCDWKKIRFFVQNRLEAAGISSGEPPGTFDSAMRVLRFKSGESEFQALCNELSVLELENFSESRIYRDVYRILLDRLPARLGVLSLNCRKTLETAFSIPALAKLEPVLIGKEDIREAKPNPEGITLLLKHFGVPSERTVYIGDSDVDAQAAASAKVRFIEVDCGRPFE